MSNTYGDRVASVVYELYLNTTYENIQSITPPPKSPREFPKSRDFHDLIYQEAIHYLYEKENFNWISWKNVIMHFVQQYRDICDKE